MRWHVHDLHSRIAEGALRGNVAVVIDVLRASTTMVTALAHGAAGVVPVAGVDEARRRAAAIGQAAVLGGERGGVRIDGFDLGNSPAEYTAGRVAGRTVVITTTNGTAAIASCAEAHDVLVGAIVNRSAVAAAARRLAAEAGGAVHLVCAGTDGAVTAEDVLAAGAILDAAARDPVAAGDELDGPARAARDAFRRLTAGGAADLPALQRAFAAAPGGFNLVALGMAADLATCAGLDSVAVVPRLDRASGTLERA
ncbi:MAG: 2-phosphosulfolactate phosphatase [Planctomycetaceae bacterium]